VATARRGNRTPWQPLDPGIAASDRAGAEACAAEYAPTAKATTKDGKGESVTNYSTRWLATRTKKAAKDNASHLTHHVLPVIGPVSILKLTSKHGDALVGALDAKIVAGTMSAKTARNVWGTIRRMLRDAAHAKPATGLRCLDVSPFRDVMGPERTHEKLARQFLYPSEFLDFVLCQDVPLSWRRNVAIAVFLGLRDGEQRALRWEHVDLEHGTVNVCEVFDRSTKTVRDGTKTGASRTVPIPPALVPLLTDMRERAGGTGLVCRGIASQRAMARGLRTWLRKADVTRTALLTSTSVSLAIRWHDLRATCGTWMAVAGCAAHEIRDVLGHTQTSMTDRYVRAAASVRGGHFGAPFPALPALVSNRHSIVSDGIDARKLPESNEFLRGGRDSNAFPVSFASARRRSVFRLIVRVPSPFCPLAISTAVR
jgi:integrase